MKNAKLTSTSIFLALVAFLWLALPGQAYPPFLGKSAKFGAKDCTFCHTRSAGGEGWNERGKWLIAEKEKRQADSINVEWLAEYGDQAAAPANQAAEKSDKWAELESFHEVMAQTFHPAEEGNLKPIRSQAGELAARARKWMDSVAPPVYDTPSIKALLVKLNAETRDLADLVGRNGSDEDVKKSITDLHGRFHEIIGACRMEKNKKK